MSIENKELARIISARIAELGLSKAEVHRRIVKAGADIDYTYFNHISRGRVPAPAVTRVIAQVLELAERPLFDALIKMRIDQVMSDYAPGEPTARRVLEIYAPKKAKGVKTPAHSVPLVGTAPSNTPLETVSAELLASKDRTVEAIEYPGSGCFGVSVGDESMMPSLPPGTVLVVDPSRKASLGELVLMQSQDGTTDIGYYQKGRVEQGRNYVMLRKTNPAFDTMMFRAGGPRFVYPVVGTIMQPAEASRDNS